MYLRMYNGVQNLLEKVTRTIDINECDVGRSNCTHHADCIDTDEGFDCQCSVGYEGHGFIECSSECLR